MKTVEKLIPITTSNAAAALLSGHRLYIKNKTNGRVCRVHAAQDDTDCFNPREDFEHLSTMVTWECNGYSLSEKIYPFEEMSFEYKRVKSKPDTFVKLIYLYDHSGISVHFDRVDQWDTSQLGFMYASKKDVFDYFGNRATDDNWQQLAEEAFQSEVKLLNQWLSGEVYWYEIETRFVTKCIRDDGREWETYDYECFDSCGGYFGYDFEQSGLIDAILQESEDKQFYTLEVSSVVEEKEDGTYDE